MLKLELASCAFCKLFRLLPQLLLLHVKVDENGDLRPKHIRIERLEHVIHSAHRITLEDVGVFLVDGTEENDGDVAGLFARLDDLRNVKPVHLRHLHVEKDCREVMLKNALQCFIAGMCRDERLPKGFQNRLECEEILRPVIDEQKLDASILRHLADAPVLFVIELVMLTRRDAICSSGSISASGTTRAAAAGIALLSAVSGSCTIPMPPRSTMCLNPRDPSSLAPVSTTPTVAFGYASPADMNVTSIEGRLNLTIGSVVSVKCPLSTSRW